MFVYKTPAFPDVSSQPLCPLTVTVDRCQHLKNARVCIQNTPAFPNIASRLLCPLTVMVNRCQHCIQNTSTSRRFESTAMSLDSHGRQVPAFKNCQCSYTQHQHFKNASTSQHYKSTAMSLDSHGRQVPALYTKHQHFPTLQVDCYVP